MFRYDNIWFKSGQVIWLLENRPLFDKLPKIFKKLVSILTIFVLIKETSKKDKVVLKKVPYIYYLLYFRKDKKIEMQALINSNSKINAIKPAYTLKLGLKVDHIDNGTQKIDEFTFQIFEIVLARFQVEDR